MLDLHILITTLIWYDAYKSINADYLLHILFMVGDDEVDAIALYGTALKR